MIAEYRVITQAEIDTAREEYERVDEAAQRAWARVEAATQEAHALEAQAAELRERAQRLAYQLGFRRPS